MIELLSSTNVNPNPYFLIQFEDVPVGTLGLNIQSKETWNFQRIVQNTPTDGVVDHPTYGKCYRLDGNVRFLEPTKRFNLLMLSKFSMEIDYVTENTYAQLFDFGSQSESKLGWNMYEITQGGKWLWAFFATFAGGGHATSFFPGAAPTNKLVRLRITRDGSVMTIRELESNITDTQSIGSTYISDQLCALFSMANGHGGNMKGWIKRFSITPG